MATIAGPWLITVELKAGRNLKAADSNGLSDPYAKLLIGGQKFKSGIVKKTLNPAWNQTFSGIVYSSGDRIRVDVWDHDTWSKDDPLGHVEVPIAQLELNKPVDRWYPLTAGDKGEVHLILTARKST